MTRTQQQLQEAKLNRDTQQRNLEDCEQAITRTRVRIVQAARTALQHRLDAGVGCLSGLATYVARLDAHEISERQIRQRVHDHQDDIDELERALDRVNHGRRAR